jgi:hypothetical protein
MAEESRTDDPSRIDNDEISRRDQRGEIAKMPMRDRSSRALDNHEPTRIPRLDRVLRDRRRRKRIIVICGARPVRRQNNSGCAVGGVYPKC